MKEVKATGGDEMPQRESAERNGILMKLLVKGGRDAQESKTLEGIRRGGSVHKYAANRVTAGEPEDRALRQG